MGRGTRERGRPIIPIVTTALVIVTMVAVIAVNARHHAHSPANSGNAIAAGGASSAEPVPASTPPTPAPTPSPTTKTPSVPPATSPPPPPPSDNPAAAAAAVNQVDALDTASGQYGVAVLDRTSGAITMGRAGTTQFFAASVVKLYVVVDILHQVETGAVQLGAGDLDAINRALTRSDDNAMDELWEDFDGPAAVQQMIGLAGLHDTQLPSDPTQWGEVLISARDVLSVYRYALTALSPADSAFVFGDLANATDTGADGFDQAFGLLNPPRPATVKAKQGWMIYGSQMMLHTTGALGGRNQYVVVLLSTQPTAIGWAAGQQNVDQATSALLAALGPSALS